MRQVLRPGALGRLRGIGWRGRWEGGSGWGTHVNPWLIHVSVWQNPLQYCKVISLQLIKINGKKKKMLMNKNIKKKLLFLIAEKNTHEINMIILTIFVYSLFLSLVALTTFTLLWSRHHRVFTELFSYWKSEFLYPLNNASFAWSCFLQQLEKMLFLVEKKRYKFSLLYTEA